MHAWCIKSASHRHRRCIIDDRNAEEAGLAIICVNLRKHVKLGRTHSSSFRYLVFIYGKYMLIISSKTCSI